MLETEGEKVWKSGEDEWLIVRNMEKARTVTDREAAEVLCAARLIIPQVFIFKPLRKLHVYLARVSCGAQDTVCRSGAHDRSPLGVIYQTRTNLKENGEKR